MLSQASSAPVLYLEIEKFAVFFDSMRQSKGVHGEGLACPYSFWSRQ